MPFILNETLQFKTIKVEIINYISIRYVRKYLDQDQYKFLSIYDFVGREGTMDRKLD